MPNEEPTLEAEQLKPQFLRASDYKALYFNHSQVGFTAFDIFAILSEAGSDQNNQFTVEQRARITMSPQQAALLSQYLANAVKLWQQNSEAADQATEENLGATEDES